MNDAGNESPRAQRAAEIEARAGQGLRREYWLQNIPTPLGGISRRAVVYTLLGLVMTCGLLTLVIYSVLLSLPQPSPLPTGDAATVMTHVHANFNGNKADTFARFAPPDGQTWQFDNAQAFFFTDVSGARQQVVVASYGDLDTLRNEYLAYSSPLQGVGQGASIRTGNVAAEFRATRAYAPRWRALRLSNLMLLATPNINEADWEQLQSHFLSIVGAAQREAIPTATP